jgi:replicative DNA helicase
LASFRESSELEFGADDAFILVPDEDGDRATLRPLKARHTEPVDIVLRFDRRHQSFTKMGENPPEWKPPGRLQSALAAMWERTAPADEDDGGRDT